MDFTNATLGYTLISIFEKIFIENWKNNDSFFNSQKYISKNKKFNTHINRIFYIFVVIVIKTLWGAYVMGQLWLVLKPKKKKLWLVLKQKKKKIVIGSRTMFQILGQKLKRCMNRINLVFFFKQG